MNHLVEILLEKGADPNVQSSKQTNSQTPMHKAIVNNHEDILNIFIKHIVEQKGKLSNKFLANFNIKDSEGQSVLSLCLWSGLIALAKKLIGNLILINFAFILKF
jgi:ankyrin repeat protein